MVRTTSHRLTRLKYLKMDANPESEWFEQLQAILDGSQLGIEYLELDDCLFNRHNEDIFKVAPLPDLRVLSLRFPRAIWPDRLARISGAGTALQLYPKLRRVLFWDDHNGDKWVYSRPEGRKKADSDAELEAEVEDEGENGDEFHDRASEDLDSVYNNVSVTEVSHEESTGEQGVLHWEERISAETKLGTMWWRHFDE
ncbi:hypothetical protein D9619_011438 [Psilocybe cf. subviscida]|uniref:Uncharacterized protein n=1 Tax=Psilocybe cf. subviscida TaxID=2480587 RepID=A0A8H5BS86_9AGAR|nr:hypothetical protein D9619_011438 [Psilocybe cf. subviscida]